METAIDYGSLARFTGNGLALSDARPLNDYRSTRHEDSTFMENVTGPLLGFFASRERERERKRVDRGRDGRRQKNYLVSVSKYGNMEENEILGLREETREREINFVQILNQDRGKDRVGSCDIDRLNAAVGGCIYTSSKPRLSFN